MQLHQLKYFTSVVNTGSVTKAAQRCFISQPLISQQIADSKIGRRYWEKIIYKSEWQARSYRTR